METDFAIDPAMAYAGLSIVPVFIWFFLQRLTIRLLLLGSLSILMFSQGTLEILGISTVITRLLVELIVIIYFIYSFIMTGSSVKRLPGILGLIAFILVSALSLIFSEYSITLLILFFRDYLFAIILLYAAINSSYSDYESKIIYRLIAFLFISQILAGVIKLAVIGDIVEPYVGTMANLGGSLTIIFSLLGSAVCISLYMVKKKYRYLFVLLGLIAFSIIGGKRAVIVYLPLLYFVLLIVNQLYKGIKIIYILRQLALFAVISLTIVYLSARLMPSLNPDERIWGEFNIEYALDYGTRYIQTGAGAIEHVGRAQAPSYLLSEAYSESYQHLLIGYGAGHLIKSRFNPLIGESINQDGFMEELYGVGYGARTAFLQLFLQVGLLGVIFYLLICIGIFRSELRYYQRYIPDRNLALLIMSGVAFVFILDFFTYSIVFTQLGPVMMCVALLLPMLRYVNKNAKPLHSGI